MRNFAFSALAVLCLTIPGLTQTHRPTPTRPTPKTKAPELPAVPLPSEPGLYAVIYTSMGNIVCRLFEKEAPKTVANFRALATGTKPWTDPKTGRVKHTPLYSGTTFHRVIPDFMIQGGDPTGTGTGSPGYKFDDEIDSNLKFDRPGILAMANSGPNTNGCQFFITVGRAEHLNGHYSIFGEVVSGQDVADAISKVPRNSEDKPDEPVTITAVAIRTVKASADSGGAKPVEKQPL
jgi:peptidyl-prolyl cis-trans isomerase A (cyclophilin A)